MSNWGGKGNRRRRAVSDREMRRREAELKENEERFRIAQELSPDGFTILRPVRDSQGRVCDFVWIYENGAIARMNGTDPATIVGCRLHEVFPEHRDTPFEALYKEVAQTGIPGTLEASFQSRTMQSPVWFRVAVVPIREDIAILAQDITQRKLSEQMMLESRAKLAAALSSMSDAVLIIDADGKIAEFNDAFVRFYRFRCKEDVVDTVTAYRDLLEIEFYPGEPAQVEYWPESRALRGERGGGAEYQLRRKDSGETWVGSFSFAPIKSSDGRITGAIVTARDVTYQKEAENRLRISEEKFAKAFAHNAAAMAITRLPDRCIVEVNDRWLATYQYRREEVIGRTAVELGLWLSDEVRQKAIAELHAKGSLHDIEAFLRNRFGQESVVLVSAVTVEVAGEEFEIWSHVDITERKRAEETLRREKSQLQSIMDNAPVLISIKDLEGRMLLANRAIFDLVDVPEREQFIGHSVFEIFPSEVAQVLWANDLKALESKQPISAEETVRHRDGSWHTYLTAKFPVLYLDTREPFGICAISTDITPVKVAEEMLRKAKDELEIRVQERTRQLQEAHTKLETEIEERVAALETLHNSERLLIQQSRLAAMGEMLGNIAHQWRQPLNMLGLHLQNLVLSREHKELNDQVLHETVEKGMQLILHMSHTIDEFRQFLEPEKEQETFSVNEVLAATLSFFEATLKTANIQVQVRETGKLYILGRKNEFSQVIMNLITNAREVFQERGVSSPLLVIEVTGHDAKAVITVSDNAGGIPEEIIDKIFDPYFTTKGPRGTGIGLFMSKNIIEKRMGGTLQVRNIADGAEFRIEV